MNKSDFERFEYLSEKSVFGEPSEVEFKELQKLMDIWNISVINKDQLSSFSRKDFKQEK